MRKRALQHERFNDSRRRGVLGRFRLGIEGICSGAGSAALPSAAMLLLAAMAAELRPVWAVINGLLGHLRFTGYGVAQSGQAVCPWAARPWARLCPRPACYLPLLCWNPSDAITVLGSL